MRRIKELKKSLFALVCLFCGLQISGGIAQADTLTLTPAGLKHLDEIQKMLHPAPVYESSRGEKYFYGLIIDAYSAPDPAAPWQSLKGRPHYKVIAFDTRGVNRSQAVVLSSFWVKPFNTIDTLLDLRTYASNRDVIYNTYIGSRKYMASLLQAIDPNGTLGLVPTGSSSTHESKGLVKGALELFLCKPFGRGEEDEYFLTMNQMLKERRPLITAPHGMRYLGDGSGLAYSIAKARKYPVYEPGFERAAMALLLLRTNLITVDPTRSECSNFLYQHGLLTTRTLIKLVRAANPRPLEKKDSRLESIDRRLAKETNPEEKKKLLESRKRILKYIERKNKVPVKPPMLPVNDSELAMVAVAILMSSEAPYLVDTDSKSYLVSACTNLKYKVNGRSTQDDSHVDVEPYAIKLMARLLNPKSCESEKRWKARQKAANEYRILVLGKLRESEEEYNAAVEIFNTAGWKADSKTIEVVKDLIESGYGTARDIEHERVTGNDEDKIKAKLEWLRLTLRKAKAISLLAYKDDPEEVKIGQVLLSLIEQYRRKQEEDKTLKIILEIWDVL